LFVRWLYHVRLRTSPLAETLTPGDEGFIHASYRDAVRETAQLYFARDAQLTVLQIDPRRLTVPVEEAATPRGPMPHIHGVVPIEAIVAHLTLDEIDSAPDRL
jgi:uncharacterized protein (DUF952 family)